MPYADGVACFLAAAYAQQRIRLGVVEAAEGQGSEAERRGDEVEILPEVAGLDPDVAIAALAVLPHRALEQRGDEKDGVRGGERLLAERHGRELLVEVAGANLLQLV